MSTRFNAKQSSAARFNAKQSPASQPIILIPAAASFAQGGSPVVVLAPFGQPFDPRSGPRSGPHPRLHSGPRSGPQPVQSSGPFYPPHTGSGPCTGSGPRTGFGPRTGSGPSIESGTFRSVVGKFVKFLNDASPAERAVFTDDVNLCRLCNAAFKELHLSIKPIRHDNSSPLLEDAFYACLKEKFTDFMEKLSPEEQNAFSLNCRNIRNASFSLLKKQAVESSEKAETVCTVLKKDPKFKENRDRMEEIMARKPTPSGRTQRKLQKK